jgi:hypothetical protein
MNLAQSSNSKGRTFEDTVYAVLIDFQNQHPSLVHIAKQQKLPLYDGQQVIPDFNVEIDVGFAKHCYLIECQNRQRSSTAIAHKIKSIKSLSPHNVVIFVHATEIPAPTKKALDADGVSCMSIEDFKSFISNADETLKRIGSMLRDATAAPKSKTYKPVIRLELPH